MPNRIIKETICTSDRLSELSDFEFRLWVGLLVSADDAGRGDARPAIIKGKVFPLLDKVTVNDIGLALIRLAEVGCIGLYEVAKKPYFWFPTWSNHQRIRDIKPKYPSPDEADVVSGWVEDDASTFSQKGGWPYFNRGFSLFGQSAADCGKLPQIAADCGLNPIQYESNTNTKRDIGQSAKANRPSELYSDPLFVQFWELYPRKEKKLSAWKAWLKLKVDDTLLATMLDSLKAWKTCEQWQDAKFIPHPATFLNARQWEDRPTVVEKNEQGGLFTNNTDYTDIYK